MKNEIIVFVAATLVTLILLFPFKKIQIKRKIGQYIREEGPDLHNHKTGTPTAAGLIFLPVALLITMLVSGEVQTNLIVLSGILFGLVGFFDDVAKIMKKNAAGISAKTKLFFQFAFAALIIYLIQRVNPHTYMVVPFSGAHLELGWFYYIASAFIIVGMSNAVNLTDGVDGLAGSVFVFSIMPLFLVSYQSVVFAALAGTLLGFLWHNSYPASVFMGDTGSLSLGGILAVSFAINGLEIFLLFFGFIFIIEELSVIIQVSSFKIFKKRVFKMSPIHHHFELSDWKESKITFRFSMLALILSVIGASFWKVI